MQRKDRLFKLITILRDGALHRAEDLARRLGVSPRTIYRDTERLIASGVPIEGARGVGYRVREEIGLPPLTLSAAELEALNLGLAIVGEAADETLRAAADTLAEKIDVVLPVQGIAAAQAWQDTLAPFADPKRNLTHMPLLRSAIRARQKVRVTYTAQDGAVTTHNLRPLHMEYWGRIWTLTGWCEGTERFEVLRLDQMESTEALPDLFVDEPGKRLGDYVPATG